MIALDPQVLVLVDHLALIAAFLAVFLPADDQVPIVDNAFPVVVLDAHVHVALAMNENLFLALGVVKTPLVATGAAGSGVAFDAAEFVVVGVLGIEAVTQVG